MPELKRPNYPPLPPWVEPKPDPRVPYTGPFKELPGMAAKSIEGPLPLNYVRETEGWLRGVSRARVTVADYPPPVTQPVVVNPLVEPHGD